MHIIWSTHGESLFSRTAFPKSGCRQIPGRTCYRTPVAMDANVADAEDLWVAHRQKKKNNQKKVMTGGSRWRWFRLLGLLGFFGTLFLLCLVKEKWEEVNKTIRLSSRVARTTKLKNKNKKQMQVTFSTKGINCWCSANVFNNSIMNGR